MTTTLAIDPGKQHLGYSFWLGSKLLACGVSKLPPAGKVWSLGDVCQYHHAQLPGLPVNAVVVERMSMNKGRDNSLGKAIATANDLLQLTAIAAYVAGRVGGAIRYVAHHACPKNVTENRVLSRLSSDELRLVDAALAVCKKRDDLFDSLAHGMNAVGRFG